MNANVLHASGYCWNGTTYLMAYLKSTDGGQHWAYKTLTSGYGFGYAVAVEASNTQNIYVGGSVQDGTAYYGKLFKSTNGGMDFTEIGTSMTSMSGYIYDLATDPQVSGRVYAGAGAGAYRSTDGGNTWTRNTGYVPTPLQFAFVPGAAN
ncbi:MAG: hypothetical protein FJY85_23080, partial [Deltaproteobacteria bacterium]|nr:hypothetical protein [Deltaproteobacteria bacterium]